MTAALLSLLLAAPAPACAPIEVKASRFAPGEQLRYRLDVVGADVGTFEVAIDAPKEEDRKRAALVARSRAKTNAFVSTNLGRYEGFISTLIGPDLKPVRFREELDEGDRHRAVEVEFPPRDGKLVARSSVDGASEPLDLDAGPQARDLVSSFLYLRAIPLKAGTPICLEVYAARKMWSMTGSVGPREAVDIPLGKFNAVRIDLVAVRLDDESVKRSAHAWITDDDRRLPLVAIGEVRGKTFRAQLFEAPAARLKATAAKPDRKTGSQRVGTSIGR
ncbi:MAG TPA: DUF3108 domain-containing protein [Myxococcales bacterium]|nr:DUF3108 domain-containing protein [Myxococcales bacterium]